MDPVTAWIVAVIALVMTVILSVVLAHHWDGENRGRYPERTSSRLFEFNRRPRR